MSSSPGSPPPGAQQGNPLRWAPFVIASIIIIVVAAAITDLFGFGDSEDSGSRESDGAAVTRSATPAPARIENVSDEAAARSSFWVGSVTKYVAPESALYDLGSPAFNSFGDGDVVVYTPKKLWEEASDLEGETVVVAGRFLEGQKQRSEFEVEGVRRIRGREPGFDVYIGSRDFYGEEVGAAGWAVVRIIASGETRPASGGRWRTVYAVSDYKGEFDTDPDPGSRAIRQALARVRASR